ncbi:hypothetical protein bcgnr5369_68630 [Bacillus cereus]
MNSSRMSFFWEERDQKLKTYEQQLDEYKKKYGNSSSDKNLSDTEKKE